MRHWILPIGGTFMPEKKMKIVTNNPAISTNEDMPHDIIFVEGSPVDVLDKTEELVQQHWSLLSTPLPPNIPIMRGPYRSLVIKEADEQYDTKGLLALDKARTRYVMEREFRTMDPNADFGEIDRTMLYRTLRDISLSNL